MQSKEKLLIMAAALAVSGLAQPATAALNAVDTGPYLLDWGYYPRWYQDTEGMGLELCLSRAQTSNGPLCVLLPPDEGAGFDPTQPVVFPDNFPDETFWFAADAVLEGDGISVRYVAALEAAFGIGPVLDGDQISFARIRIRATVPSPGTYVVTHPYGVEVFEVPVAGRRVINFTSDLGIGGPGDFTGALGGAVGPFLVSADGFLALGEEFFIGDPNIGQAVTGSPFDTNYLRIQGPGGIDLQTDQFALAGKVFAGALETPLVIERTTYSRDQVGDQTEVFVTSSSTAALAFTDLALNEVPMAGDQQGRFFGQSRAGLPDPLVPALASLEVRAENLPANNTPVSRISGLKDLVTISRAEYDRVNQTLVVEASSSDQHEPPLLTATLTPGRQADLEPTGSPGLQRFVFTEVVVPPARVRVESSQGGSDLEEVVVLP